MTRTPTIQKAALEKEGWAIVLEENRSGDKRDGRIQLELAREGARRS